MSVHPSHANIDSKLLTMWSCSFHHQCPGWYRYHISYLRSQGQSVNYNGRTPYVSNYFYCHIPLEGLLRDAEHDLLAIAKFLVMK